eukprot:scaffold66816_cov52-Phaeocystis_antarctica.AAC.2
MASPGSPSSTSAPRCSRHMVPSPRTRTCVGRVTGLVKLTRGVAVADWPWRSAAGANIAVGGVVGCRRRTCHATALGDAAVSSSGDSASGDAAASSLH